MEVKSVRFLKSALWPKDWPQTSYPEVAFAGRSNVGKSSLLRTLLGQRKLVRVSSTPGCTRTINFYLVNESYIFADLPGYGFAKVAAKMRSQWGRSIETYLAKRPTLKGVVLLLDARHGPLENDQKLWHWLKCYQLPTIIVLTKVDKLKQSERHQCQQLVQKKLNANSLQSILFSARTGEGKKEVWKAIYNLLKTQ